MSELLRWFGKRREVRAINLMEKHLANVVSAVEDLDRAIKAALRGSEEDVKASISRVVEAEKEADRLRRAIMDELASEVIPAAAREDLMHLVKRLDMIADWSREATRILASMPMSDIPKKILESCSKMTGKVVECAHAVRKAVIKLLEEPEEALKEADRVERLEEEVDELYAEARRTFALMGPGEARPSILILARDLLDAIENVADWCENSCDQVRVICITIK